MFPDCEENAALALVRLGRVIIAHEVDSAPAVFTIDGIEVSADDPIMADLLSLDRCAKWTTGFIVTTSGIIQSWRYSV